MIPLLTGFDEKELADLFADDSGSEARDDDFDLTAALEKASFVERGDVWTVGRHRLVCGDATSAEDVALLMDWQEGQPHRDRPALWRLLQKCQRPDHPERFHEG